MADRAQDQRSAVAVLHIGGMDHGADHQTQRVGSDMALATLHALSRDEAAWTSAFGGSHAPAVDDTGRRAGLAPLQFAHRHDKHVIRRPQQTAVTPVVEVPQHGGEGRKVARKPASLAASVLDVLDGAHLRPLVRGSRAPQAAGKRQQRRNQPPFPLR